VLVEGADVRDGLADRVAHGRADRGLGRGELGVADAQVVRGDPHAVEALERADDGGVAVGAHVLDDLADRGAQAGVEDLRGTGPLEDPGAPGIVEAGPAHDGHGSVRHCVLRRW